MAAKDLVGGSALPTTGKERSCWTRKKFCGSSRLPQKACFKIKENVQARLTVDREMGIRCHEHEIEAKQRQGQQHSGFVCPDPSICKWTDKKKVGEPLSLEMLDRWIRDSVTEIVSNTGEAPFLLYVYSKKGGGISTRLEKAASAESWAYVKNAWVNGSCCCPDGLILVEQLKEEVEEDDGGGEKKKRSRSCWGLVIQGKGIDCSACYILKTSRVCTPAGFCTHFCLIRAKCFGDSAEKQFRDSWLQQIR